MKTKACGICLAPGDSINHLDHLAPIALFMGIPMVVDEEFLIGMMKTYYPQVETIFIDHHAKILEYLAQNYDYLFCSCANYRASLSPLLEVIFRKKMQFWYCNHGHSDKSVEHFKYQNLAFVYGDHMQESLEKGKYLDQMEGYVRTGNYRFSFYKKFEIFYDEIVEKEIFSHFTKKQKTILYAPTWDDLESSTSFFDVTHSIIDQLPSHYNLIVKLHPWLMHYTAGQVHHLEEKYRDHSNVQILGLYPLTLPILKRTDIYLGDFSSISYDFLYYNRPMFFFEGSKRIKERMSSSHIHQCGTVIPPNFYDAIYPFIEKNLPDQKEKEPLRTQLYHHAFGEEKPFDLLKQEVEEVIASLGLGDKAISNS